MQLRRKEAIFMTRAQLAERIIDRNPLNRVNMPEYLSQHHFWVLLTRLEKGRVLPLEVLADYPGIEAVVTPLEALDYWWAYYLRVEAGECPGAPDPDFILTGLCVLEDDFDVSRKNSK